MWVWIKKKSTATKYISNERHEHNVGGEHRLAQHMLWWNQEHIIKIKASNEKISTITWLYETF